MHTLRWSESGIGSTVEPGSVNEAGVNEGVVAVVEDVDERPCRRSSMVTAEGNEQSKEMFLLSPVSKYN
jgi:hypothetical protein